MALKVYNGSTYDDVVGSASIGGTNVSVTAAGITSLGNTAPNTTNQSIGTLIAVVSLPTTANFIVELLESGVVKATETINLVDMRMGFMYVRFATPYTFATTGAGAYTIRVKSSSGTQGVLRTITAGNLWNQIVYNSNTALGATDNVWVGGYVQNSGVTTKNLALTGTSNSWGDGADNSMVYTTQWTMGASTTIFQGGSVTFDTTANCKLTQLGSIVVYRGGLFDMRPGSAYVNTLEFNQQSTDGRFGILHVGNLLGGQVLTTGKTVTVARQYASGDGSTGSPLTFKTAHGLAVGDELIIPGLSHSTNQIRFVRTVVNATQVTTAATAGGAESAFTNTPAVDSWISNLTRNSIIKNTGTAHGFWIMNADINPSPVSSYAYTRLEYPNCLSGKGVVLSGSTLATDGNDAIIDGLVLYNNSAAARTSIQYSGKVPQTISNIILYNTKGSNYSAQSGIGLQNATGKIFDGIYHYAEPGSTTNCAGFSFTATATSNVLRNYHSYGANAQNGSLGYSIGIFGAGNTISNSTINGSRVAAIRGEGAILTTLNNCNFGTIANNTIDLVLASSTLNTILYNNCNFGSTTLISNYQNMLDGSEVKYHKYQSTAHRHLWYTPYGSAEATGSGLSDTTVRTAGSYNIKIKPENNTRGFVWEFTVKSITDQIAFLKAYLRKNATMGASVAKVEIFMPGTDTTGVADATFTASSTPDTWQDFLIGKGYTGSENTEALIRVTAISATAGAAIYLADFYDSTEALNSWFEAKPTKVVAPADFSAVAGLFWSYPDTDTTAGTMGRRQVETADNAELAAVKP